MNIILNKLESTNIKYIVEYSRCICGVNGYEQHEFSYINIIILIPKKS